MKKSGWAALLILVATSSYFYHGLSDKKEETSLHPEQTEMNPLVSASPHLSVTSTVSTVNATSSPPPILLKPAHPKGADFSQRPKDPYVQFEVINGYAVAYGDTILGKPTRDFQETVGMAEVKSPKYWAQGVIPYVIENDVPNPERIKNALELLNNSTNVKFVPYENQSDALVFVNGEQNCQSYLGKVGGLQPVFLSPRCGLPEILHELMHALGFVHEQSRIDRDQYLNIFWDNIDEKFRDQYAMVPEILMESLFDSPLDPTSIMMYEAHMFAKSPGLITMSLRSGEPLEAPLGRFTKTDIERVNRLYSK